MRILLGMSWSDHQPYGQAPCEPRNSCSIRPQRERRQQSLWTRRSSGSSAVLEAGSPGHPLSTWSCQSQLRGSAFGGTRLSDSVIYPPTDHLPLQRVCPLASAYSRLPFVLVLVSVTSSSFSFFNGFCLLIPSGSSIAFTYSHLLSTHDLCCFLAFATIFSLHVFLLHHSFPRLTFKFLRKIIWLVQIVTIIC